MALDIERILRILPHRAPFVFVDRVVTLEPRRAAHGVKLVSYAEPALRGHFPDRPVFPAMLVIEALSQLFALLAYASEPFDTDQRVFHLVGVDKAKFRRPVVPGDTLGLDVELTTRRSNIWRANAVASVGTVVAAEAQLLAAIVDRHELPTP